MSLRRAQYIAVICLLACSWSVAYAQTASSPSAAEPQSLAELDPETAFLSPTRYVNAFFGFVFEFPPDTQLKPVPMPASLDRRIQLLVMTGSSSTHPLVSISAFEYKGKNWTDAKGILRRELDQELFTGVEELHGLSKTTIDGHQFFYFETRKGVTQHVELATELNGYVLLIVLQANDASMVKNLTNAFYRTQFFPPQEAKQHAGPEAVAYEGPAISSQRLRELKAAPPAASMDPGQIDGSVYRNAQIGFRYEFPKGWNIEPKGAVEPAVERYRAKVEDEPVIGPRERDVVKACRRTLLSAWKTKPGADSQVPYDDFGEVTLSAMPLFCFPNLKFPDNPKDADAVRRFLVGFSFTQPLQRDMRDARAYEADGKTMLVTFGTIAYKEEGDALSRRISVALAITQHRGYLLVWLFAAPHDSELRELMKAKVSFDPDPATEKASRVTGGAADTASDSHSEVPSPQPGGGGETSTTTIAQPPAAPSKAAAGPAGSDVPADPTASSPAPASSTSYHPTLLRDGENMDSQQGQGKPLPPRKPN